MSRDPRTASGKLGEPAEGLRFDTATGMVVGKLSQAIGNGTYRPGDPLPSQRKLAQEFDVSQSTVQDAVRVLRERGLVTTRQGKGAFVRAKFSTEAVADGSPLINAEHATPAEVEAIARVRFEPVYAVVGAIYLALRTALQDAGFVDVWWVTERKAVLEWEGGPEIAEVLRAVLPRSADTPDVLAGVPGLRVLNETEAETSLAWLGAAETSIVLRRLDWAAEVAADAGEGRLVIWIPESIRERMRRVRTETSRVYRDQVLDAVEATHERLPELISAAREASDETVEQGTIFERAVKPQQGERRVQLTVRGFLPSQIAVIDKLVERSESSRSELLIAALDAALPSVD